VKGNPGSSYYIHVQIKIRRRGKAVASCIDRQEEMI
jgi:hypothetical protein